MYSSPPSLIFLYSLVLLSVCTRNLSQAIPIVKHTCVFIVFNPYLQLNRGGGHTFECTKYHRIVHFKMVNFMLCELCVCVCVYRERDRESEVTQSCLTFCDPMDCNLPGSSVHGIFRARVLECIAISFSRGCSQPRDQTRVSHIAGRRFTI